MELGPSCATATSKYPPFVIDFESVLGAPFYSVRRAEQAEIVRRVESLLKLADTIERRVVAATVKADKITQAVLAKAFRGELVPTEAELARAEGREYETADQLLARIGQELAQRKSEKKRGKITKRREQKEEQDRIADDILAQIAPEDAV